MTYLKPYCEQAIKCMLPLPRWCHEEELKAQLEEQENTDPETILVNEKVTVNLSAILSNVGKEGVIICYNVCVENLILILISTSMFNVTTMG